MRQVIAVSDPSERVRDGTDARARLREFVRTHHPDVGGDPELFAARVAELQAARDGAYECSRPAGPRRAERGEAPIVVVRRRGPRGLLARLREWRARRKRGPRVV